jgi:hypothetical protein
VGASEGETGKNKSRHQDDRYHFGIFMSCLSSVSGSPQS